MAQYFLAGAANVDLYEGTTLFSSSKTMISNSIELGVTLEEIRAGQTAKLYGKYAHSAFMNMDLSDAMFRIEYIQKNVGGTIEIGGDAPITEQVVIGVGGAITVAQTPVVWGGTEIVGWAKPVDGSNWTTITFVGKAATIPGATEGATYCVKYFTENSSAKTLTIPADFIPATVHAVLTANLYAGDASNPSSGTKVGTVVIDIPRFMLNGSQTISLNMTGASNTDLSGSALASQDAASCDDQGYYAKITEVILGSNWYDDALGLMIADGVIDIKTEEQETLKVYAVYANAAPKLLDNAILNFVIGTGDEGIATVGANTGIVKGVGQGQTSVTITVAGGVAQHLEGSVVVNVTAA